MFIWSRRRGEGFCTPKNIVGKGPKQSPKLLEKGGKKPDEPFPEEGGGKEKTTGGVFKGGPVSGKKIPSNFLNQNGIKPGPMAGKKGVFCFSQRTRVDLRAVKSDLSRGKGEEIKKFPILERRPKSGKNRPSNL